MRPFALATACLCSSLCPLACAAAPSDALSESPAPAVSRAELDGEDAIDGDCMAEELGVCVNACSDQACLDWCAGKSCRLTLTQLSTCLDEGEALFAANNPMPSMEFGPDPSGGPDEVPTEASLDRIMARDIAHEEASATHWDQACGPICTSALGQAEGEEPAFCANWQYSYYEWPSLVKPPADTPADTPTNQAVVRILGTGVGLADASAFADASILGALGVGSSVDLVQALSLDEDDPRLDPLSDLVRARARQISGLEDCAPDLEEGESRTFVFRVDLDGEGKTVATELILGSGEGHGCVADLIAGDFSLPARVARDVGSLELRAVLREVSGEGAFDGIEGISSDGAGWGGGSGQAEGIGGLGTRGSGGGNTN